MKGEWNIMNKILFFRLCVVIILLVSGVKGATADAIDEISAKIEPNRKVTYKTVGDRELQLHVFEPDNLKPTDRRPCFITIHGGGWTGGTPRRQYPFAKHYAELGLVSISIEYRLVKAGSTVFDCVKDGRSAVRYIRAHASEFGLDPQKIVVNGGSAGGHVAAGTALFEGIDEAGEDVSVSSVPNAMVLYFPVIDTSVDGYGNSKIGERWKEISPLHSLTKVVPPTIIFHGTGDVTTPFKGAKAFQEAMLKSGNRCELDIAEGAVHGYLMRKHELINETLLKTDAFLISLGFLPKAKSLLMEGSK